MAVPKKAVLKATTKEIRVTLNPCFGIPQKKMSMQIAVPTKIRKNDMKTLA